MKMVVAYVERAVVEAIREELLSLGFVSVSIVDSSGSVPEAFVTGTYRGAEIEQHWRPNARLECVVGPDQAETIVEVVGRHGGDRYFAFVVPIEGAFPADTVKVAEPAEAG